MSDGGSGGKQSPRGCAECFVMPSQQKCVRALLDFFALLKEFVWGKVKIAAKIVLLSGNSVFNWTFCLKIQIHRGKLNFACQKQSWNHAKNRDNTAAKRTAFKQSGMISWLYNEMIRLYEFEYWLSCLFVNLLLFLFFFQLQFYLFYCIFSTNGDSIVNWKL